MLSSFFYHLHPYFYFLSFFIFFRCYSFLIYFSGNNILNNTASSSDSTLQKSSLTSFESPLDRVYSCDKLDKLSSTDRIDRIYSTESLKDSFKDCSREKDRPDSGEVLWQRGELLGAGSFGQVYSGIDMSTGVRIAVKEVMLGSGKRHEQQALALLREIRILSALDHPNIIKYLGTEYCHHTMRIFLELATEGSIKDALSAFGKRLKHYNYLFPQKKHFSFCLITHMSHTPRQQ